MEDRLTFGGSYAYGIVENISADPSGDKIDAVQVRLFAVHCQDPSILPTENLPWCQILLPTNTNESASHGIRVGMCVKCSFLDQELQIPIVEGILPGVVAAGKSVTGRTDKTLSKYVDGVGVSKMPSIDPRQPADPYAAQYPLNLVYESSSGHRTEIDDTPGHERIHTYHKSGTSQQFHPDGSLVTVIQKDEFVGVVGNSTKVIIGNKIVEVKGNETVTIRGDVNLEVDGSLTGKVTGEVNITCNGMNITSDANISGSLNVEGNLTVGTGDTGIITDATGQVITVKSGIIVSIA